MPIQFRCTHCGQPVEVDDEAAEQMASCPYCRQIGRVPAATDATITHDVPVATARLQETRPSVGPTPAQTNPADRLGWIALVMMVIAVLCFLGWGVAFMIIVNEHGPMTDMNEIQTFVQEELENRPGLNNLAFFGACFLPVIGGGLAIVALARSARPRWPAIVSLCLIGGFILLMGFGSLMSLALGP